MLLLAGHSLVELILSKYFLHLAPKDRRLTCLVFLHWWTEHVRIFFLCLRLDQTVPYMFNISSPKMGTVLKMLYATVRAFSFLQQSCGLLSTNISCFLMTRDVWITHASSSCECAGNVKRETCNLAVELKALSFCWSVQPFVLKPSRAPERVSFVNCYIEMPRARFLDTL